MISKICLFSILILICYIFSTNKVLEIRLVVLIPLTTIPKFNWQLCLNLTDPNFAWFNSHSTKKVPTLGLASSYLRTSILSVFYVANLTFVAKKQHLFLATNSKQIKYEQPTNLTLVTLGEGAESAPPSGFLLFSQKIFPITYGET